MAYAVAFRMMGTREAAEEAMQTAYVDALKGLDGFRGDAKLSTWFTRIVINACNRQFRTLRRLDRVIMGVDYERVPAEETGDDRDTLQARRVLHAVEGLPDRQRAAVVLRYSQGLDLAQIAETMGCSVGAVKAHLSKAVHKLQKSLAPARGGEVIHET